MTDRTQQYLDQFEQHDADRNTPVTPAVIERGAGAVLVDTDGHESIDLSEIIANVGHCHPDLAAAVRAAAGNLITGKGSFGNPAQAELMERLAQLAPGGLDRVFLATSGSEICEWAMRIARRKTGRHEILSFWGGVYGRTYGATSMNGVKRRKRRFGPLMPGCIYAPYAYCYRCPFDKVPADCSFYCIDYLDWVIDAEGTDDLAALIVEPYLGVGGIVFPPDGYLPRLARWAADRNVVFILDEVQSAFGRTGKMLAAEWEGLAPDILCLGKGLGGGISIAALVTGEQMIARLVPGELSGGNGGNALACAAALAVLDILEREALPAHAEEVGAFLLERCRAWQRQYACIGDVRGRGLCLALEFVTDRETKQPLAGMAARVSQACYPNGVFLGGGNHILGIRPPLVITLEQAERSAAVIEAALASLCS
jgi:4-aminobutyrate aminotransferase-like enzyme